MLKKVLLVFFALTLTLTFFSVYTPASAKNDQIKLKVFVHYPNQGRPIVAPTCAVSTTDSSNYLKELWHMPLSGLNYAINFTTKPSNLTNSEVLSAINNSFETWSAPDPDQIFNYTGSTLVKNAKNDGTNVIFWKGITGGAIAITYVWYNIATAQVVDVDTAFNKNLKWTVNDPSLGDCINSATYDVQNIGTHEFGHWVGLNDLYGSADKDLTMYGYGATGELKKDTLGLGDIRGVVAINP